MKLDAAIRVLEYAMKYEVAIHGAEKPEISMALDILNSAQRDYDDGLTAVGSKVEDIWILYNRETGEMSFDAETKDRAEYQCRFFNNFAKREKFVVLRGERWAATTPGHVTIWKKIIEEIPANTGGAT